MDSCPSSLSTMASVSQGKGPTMGIANFIFRRGAIYTWRRRIPKRADSVASNLQVLLRTACPWTPRRLAAIVIAEIEKVLDQMGMEGLTPDVARQ